MRVLGIDPGLACAGFGVVDEVGGAISLVEYGAIRTPPGPVPERLAALYEELQALVERCRPHAAAVERVLFNANVRTAMSVGQAAGVALLVVARRGVQVVEYTPSEVKLAVAGDGAAAKSQVGWMVARLFGLDRPPAPADASDALALALTHLAGRRLRGVGARA